ncbi:hypothetical protein V494_05834 [Pseudogymnoascus sp. VKM F-4513 (FW-928)]|nr:hypothetical protein V494_05834 [Pseudogymnoascus sp. VKM F-4513 (FW-928)]
MTDGSGAVHRLGLGATLVPFCKRPAGTRAEENEEIDPEQTPKKSNCLTSLAIMNAENRLAVTLRRPGHHQDARATTTKRYKHGKHKWKEKEESRQASNTRAGPINP